MVLSFLTLLTVFSQYQKHFWLTSVWSSWWVAYLFIITETQPKLSVTFASITQLLSIGENAEYFWQDHLVLACQYTPTTLVAYWRFNVGFIAIKVILITLIHILSTEQWLKLCIMLRESGSSVTVKTKHGHEYPNNILASPVLAVQLDISAMET